MRNGYWVLRAGGCACVRAKLLFLKSAVLALCRSLRRRAVGVDRGRSATAAMAFKEFKALQTLLNASNPGSCAPNSAFVTLVANETYVNGAICLRKSLQRVKSACQLELVIADPLPSDAMSRLSETFGTDRVRSLSDLRRRLDRYEQRALTKRVHDQEHGEEHGRRLKESGELKNTRQLTRAGGWARRTHQKLLLFAMKGYKKLAFLDIDMLVLRNIDALLEQPAFSAVAALPYSTSSFNSGVFVFEPSLATAASLDDLSQRATFKPVRPSTDGSPSMIRIRGYGERFALSDQSILNHHYKSSWRKLPFGYNLGVKVRQVSPKMWNKIELAVIHYVHRPKPWEATLADRESPMSKLARKLGIEPLTQAWRYRCGVGPKGNGTSEAESRVLFE